MDRGAQEAMRNQMGLDLEQAATGGVLRGRGEEARRAGSAGADGRSERGVGEKIDSKAVNRAAGAIKQARAGGDAKKAGLQALGRLKAGTLNKTEQAYEALLKEWQHLGIVAWFKFEGVKLRLADNTFYTPDFAVMLANGQMELHEVKGFWQDDARAKIKIAADMYPFRFLAVRPKAKKDGGGWEREEF